jgi:hypothetical protein
MKGELSVFVMDVLVDMIDPVGVEGRTSPFYTVDFVTFFEQQFRQIRAVLPCDTSDKSFFRHTFSPESNSKHKILLRERFESNKTRAALRTRS